MRRRLGTGLAISEGSADYINSMRNSLTCLFALALLLVGTLLAQVIPGNYFESATLLLLGFGLLTVVAGHRWIKKQT